LNIDNEKSRIGRQTDSVGKSCHQSCKPIRQAAAKPAWLQGVGRGTLALMKAQRVATLVDAAENGAVVDWECWRRGRRLFEGVRTKTGVKAAIVGRASPPVNRWSTASKSTLSAQTRRPRHPF